MANPYELFLMRNPGFARYLEPALAVGSSALAEPISGVAGLGQLAFGGSADDAANRVKQIQDLMRYSPVTQSGNQGLQAVQQFMQPIADVVQGASQNLGDKAYGATGSPALAAAAYSAPTAMLEALGLKGLSIAKSPVKAADLYSARMGMGAIDDSNKLLSAVYGDRKSFFDASGNFDAKAYDDALYDAEDLIDSDTFDKWQNTDWQSSAQGVINEADRAKLTEQVKQKTLYHGSPYNFDELDVPDSGGAFLTGSKDSAKHYAGDGNIYEYRIAPRKPFFVSKTDSTYDIEQSDELIKLKEQGYDSIIPLDGGDYVVLDKSILKKVK